MPRETRRPDLRLIRRWRGLASVRPAVREPDRDQDAACALQGHEPAVTDLLGGRIDIMFAPGPVVQQFVESGQLKALGVTDTRRSKFYPDVPPWPTPCPATSRLAGSACWRRRTRRQRSSTRSTRPSSQRCRPKSSRPSGDAGRRAAAADAGRIRPLHQRRHCQMERARERQQRAIAGRKVRCVLQPLSIRRWEMMRGSASSVAKISSTWSRRQMAASRGAGDHGQDRADQRRADARCAEGTGRGGRTGEAVRPISGLKFLPPIPDPSKFFCVGKNNRKHREELPPTRC